MSGAGGVEAADGGASDSAGAGAGVQCSTGNVDIIGTQVSGTVTLNGKAITDPEFSVTLDFMREDGGASLGTTGNGGLSAMIAPGTYEVYYGAGVFTGAPLNRYKLKSGVVVGSAPVALSFDLQSTKVSGNLRVNGQRLTDSDKQGQGTVKLVDAEGNSRELALTYIDDGAYSVWLAPGSYDLVYTTAGDGDPAPANMSAKFRTGIVVGNQPLSLDIDVPSTRVSGSFSMGGTVSPCALSLRNATGDTAGLNYAGSGVYAASIIPGTYDLYCTGSGGSVDVSDGEIKVKSDIVVGSSPVTFKVDLPATKVSGKLTVNGATLSAPTNPKIEFRNAAGDHVALHMDTENSYFGTVLPGTYDVYYDYYYGGPNPPAGSPVNRSARLREGVLVSGSALTLDIDVPATPISGNFTIGGAVLDKEGVTQIGLRGQAGDYVPLALQTGAYQALVVPGTYDLYYSVSDADHAGPHVPANMSAKLKSGITIGTSPLAFDIDVPVVTLSGMVTVNGAVLKDNSTGFGVVSLSSEVNGSLNLAGTASESGDGRYSAVVIPGTYDAFYRAYGGGVGVPSNGHEPLGCIVAR